MMKPYTPEKLPISNLSWDKFTSKIGEANRNLTRYDGTLSAMINPGLLLSPLTIQDAVLSSRIEGTQVTLEENDILRSVKKHSDRRPAIYAFVN